MTSVSISNLSYSQVVVGNRNVALQLTVEGTAGYSDRYVSPPLQPRPLPVIRARAAAEPVGRESVVEEALAAVLDQRSVQLCGTPGVGKTAVAEAIARRLTAAERPGLLLAGGSARAELAPLYTELARALFSVDWYAPDETVLRTETARHRPTGVIVVPDCALDPEDAERLLGTFPECVFVFCSPQQSLYSRELVLDLAPLGLDAARALVERELGRPLDGFEHLQVQRVHELAEGRISRLLVCAAFLRRVAADARPHDVVPLSPSDQIAVLLSGVSEPARRALAALCSFGPAPDALLDALTGLEGTAGAGDELAHAGLATRSADLLIATDDAAAAMRERGWFANPLAAAAGLSPLLRPGPADAPRPSPGLCGVVAQALLQANALDAASTFTRLAAPAALAAGDLAAWQSLVTSGLRATSAGGRPENLAYFLTEEHTRNLLRGDRVAAGAAMTALAAELARHIPSGPTGGIPPRPKAPRSGQRSLRQAVQNRFGRTAASAVMIGAPIAAIATAAAAALGAAAVTRPAAAPAAAAQLTTNGSGKGSATSQATGSAYGAAGAFPYALSGQYSVQDHGGTTPYEYDAAYPVVSGLSNAALEQQINDELRAPLGKGASAMPTSGGQTQAEGTALDPFTSSTSTQVYQTGSLISVEYTSTYHNSGAADISYGVTTVTVRTDTGAVVPNSDILTAAAMSTDVDALAAELQAQPGISRCENGIDGSTGAAGVAGVLSHPAGGQPAAALTVTSAGVVFTFEDDEISGTACRPVALLSWDQLGALAGPTVEQLANTLPGGPQPTVTLTTPASASASSMPSQSPSPSPSASPSATGPATVVVAYYAAINAHDYKQAWSLGGHNLQSNYQTFASGYSGTKHDSVTILGVKGDTVTVSLTAQQNDGSSKSFEGTYTVVGGQITKANLHVAD